MNKTSLRTALLEKRRTTPGEIRKQAAEQALRILEQSNLIAPYSIVAAYWPTASEFDCTPIINWLHQKSIACALPCIVGKEKPMVFRRYNKDDTLAHDAFYNLPQPQETAPEIAPDIFLVPVVGFDRRGYRIGMGGGFYDRTLAAFEHPFAAIGLAFSANEVAAIPYEPHDVQMHAILTEKELINTFS